MLVTAGDRPGLEEGRGWRRDSSRDASHTREKVPSVDTIKPHERQWIHHEVRWEYNVKYNVHVVWLPAHEVVDGVWQTED